MATQRIPLRPDLAHYEFAVALDKVTVIFELRWSVREEAWYLDVKDEDGTVIYAGIKVVVALPLGRRCRDPRFPPGILMALDTSGRNEDPGLKDLGDRVQLLYFEAADLPFDFAALIAEAS
jgi:hypothetical protein